MSIYLVRHARAGQREKWNGDDRLRPLTAEGRAQAQHLADRFSKIAVPRVLSSPYVRCVQTVEPLAAARGLDIETCDVLAEGNPFHPLIDLLLAVPDHTVLCSHGDLIPDTIAALYRRGMDISGQEEWRKGSTWVLQRDGDSFTSAVAWAPPPAA
jgi:8-oxo-dGTP diphosphatase